MRLARMLCFGLFLWALLLAWQAYGGVQQLTEAQMRSVVGGQAYGQGWDCEAAGFGSAKCDKKTDPCDGYQFKATCEADYCYSCDSQAKIRVCFQTPIGPGCIPNGGANPCGNNTYVSKTCEWDPIIDLCFCPTPFMPRGTQCPYRDCMRPVILGPPQF